METITPIAPPINYNWSWNNTKEMSFPNIPTPPSSNEDSPRPMYFVASPGSNTFRADAFTGEGHVYSVGTSYIQNEDTMMVDQPSLKIIEQPIDKFRFRYKSEMAGTHGSLTGTSSDKSRKQTYPTVELLNFHRTAIIRCSIYQIKSEETDMKPHAHRLIKKHGKDEVDDPHSLVVSPDEGYVASFHSMGIIHTAKKNIVSELMKKKTNLKKEAIARNEGVKRDLNKKEVHDIKQEAESECKSINLNIVCLRFDAFEDIEGVLYPICKPIFTHGINNLKSALTGELKIVRMDHCTSPAKGNREIFILVERVTKKNVRIRFFELDDDGSEVWEDYGKHSDLDVHHQYAIVFKTPRYKNLDITSKVKVFIELVRPSDNARSDPKEFIYTPSDNIYRPGRKRPRSDGVSTSYDSSNFPSDELPVTIANPQDTNWDTGLPNLSKEFLNACNNIDSAEFNQLLQSMQQSDLMQIYTSPDTCATDGHVVESQMQELAVQDSVVIKMEVSSVEHVRAYDTFRQLQNLIRSKPSLERIKEMLQCYLGNDGETNPLHVFILENNTRNVLNILKLVNSCKAHDLFEKLNTHGQSPLHLAVICNNVHFVTWLLKLEVNPLIEDTKQNTPLHLAAKCRCSIEILELLISKSINLDVTNDNGDTPLNIAIEKKHMPAIKLLINNGADINNQHNNNGFTPLRFAIEKDYEEAVRFILYHKNLDFFKKDFNGIAAFQAAIINESTNTKIQQMIQNYMTEHNISLSIKQELDMDSSDDEMQIDLNEDETTVVKVEKTDELELMYNKVARFTPEALKEISFLVDQSGTSDLAKLLDLEHLIRSGILKSSNSTAMSLLKYAIDNNNEKLWVIRNFLDLLEQTAAVAVMDNMVIKCYSEK
ncbi:unnamed protein product [Brassicogethes aeneus]|uniref:RHD domain-containing protein n=1 Tax=Brassicogethes aeneus TaxID=1431903 RepID=A0A9P0FHT7_BRAAE|nr:unnamed protein product [Brassicogethes aeneus]